HILFSMAGILCVLLLFFYIDPTSSAKTLFLAPGIILALNSFCYLNIPSFNSDIGLDFSGYNSERDMAMQEIIRGEGDVEQQKKTVEKADFLAKIFVLTYMGAFLVIALAVITMDIVFISIPVIIARHINKYPLDSPESIYHKALDHGPLSNSYNYIVITLWGILLSGNLLGLYVACSLAEWLFFGTNKYITSDISSKFIGDVSFFSKLFFDQGQRGARIFLCLYLIPVLLILAFSFVRHSKNICRRAKWVLHDDVDPQIIQTLEEIIIPICRYADISSPIIRISNSGSSTYAESLFAGFPVFRNVLIISRKTYDDSLIDNGRAEALFAHEIGHMRQHTFIHRIQCVLSDISFVGTGFLSIMSSSFKIEYEADRFTVEYLKSRNTDPSCLIGLLEEIRDIERSESITKALEINTAGSLNFGMARNADYRERLMAVYGKSNFLNRFIISFKLFFQMCFGQEVLSYFHPPVDERIKRIKREYYGT
ncbi:MAG: M48 family metalloprotease, partial [Lentisphaerae bacterium]|nr:M48 family metalloprotease [Lentisphaerota bacterium]